MLRRICSFLVLLFTLPVFPASFGILGDAGVLNPETKLLRQSMKAAGIQKLLILGDNRYHAPDTYAQIWDVWLREGFQFSAVAIGNHNAGYANEVAYFHMPGEFYTVVSAGVRFVVLNSDNELTAQVQAKFLEQTLVQAQEKQLFVIFHHPFVTVSDFHSWPEKKIFQNSIRPILFKYQNRITAVLAGHDHLATALDVNGMPLVISGASFELRMPRINRYKDGPFNVRTLWNYPVKFYWSQLDTSDDHEQAVITMRPVDPRAIPCRIRIQPRPVVMGPECGSLVRRLL